MSTGPKAKHRFLPVPGRRASGTQARWLPAPDPPRPPRGAGWPPLASPVAASQPQPATLAATALYGLSARDRKREKPRRGAPRERGGLHLAPGRAGGHWRGRGEGRERRKTPGWAAFRRALRDHFPAAPGELRERRLRRECRLPRARVGVEGTGPERAGPGGASAKWPGRAKQLPPCPTSPLRRRAAGQRV